MSPLVQDYMAEDDQGNWKIEPVDFATLAANPQDAAFIACDIYICPFAHAETVPAVFAADVATLRTKLMNMIDNRPGTSLRNISNDMTQFDFMVYETGMKHPDAVTVYLHDLGENMSTLAIYSRSPLEKTDGGRNKDRVLLWLTLLSTTLPQKP